MNKTEENMQWAMEQLSQFAHLQNAPLTEETIRAHAGALLRIIHEEEPSNNLIDRQDGQGLVFEFAQVPDGTPRREWLVAAMLDACDRRYPQPIAWRRLYERCVPTPNGQLIGWCPADGRRADSLAGTVEGE